MKRIFFPCAFHAENRKKLINLLPSKSLALVFSNDRMPRSGDLYFPFRQNSDLFYLSGIVQAKTILALCPAHPQPEYREILFMLQPDAARETREGHRLTGEEATAVSGVKTVMDVEHFRWMMDDLACSSDHIYADIEENVKRDSELRTFDLRAAGWLKSRFPLHRYGRLATLTAQLRFVKQPEEIQMIRSACEITRTAFDRILGRTAAGMNEYELEAELTFEILRNGATGHAFPPIVASGKNACVLHYNDNNRMICDGELVLFDFGAELAGYNSDCSRTIPVSGRFSARQRQLYEAVLRVFRNVRAIMKPGMSIEQINLQTRRFWEEEHVRLGLYSMEDLRRQDADKPLFRKYFMHGVTHTLGLDVHDVGDRRQPLQPGAILTCEPGIYIPEEGTGIRLENDILITPSEPIDLMEDIPVEPDEIEERMMTRIIEN
ncbi:MAG: aminopeptidase P N-terminal domain-containing protein [Bacteroidales bacterium]|jgi:Xaa-Pro aminopeptidase|nr:aminopeptidase P N-terminal domain-containing protein [Bacteroidales bacterium]